MTYKILIVDDELANLRLLERLFRHDYYCLTAATGAEAIKLLEQHDVATIITDQRMPQMTGIELLKETAELRPHMVRILLTGYMDTEALVEAINCGLVYMYVTKPWNNEDLKLRVSRAIEHYGNNKKRYALETANARLTLRAEQLKAGFVRAMGEALKARDLQTYNHCRRVSLYALRVGESLGLGEEACLELSVAGMLHDVGALCNATDIACRTNRANSEAFSLAQKQSDQGAEMLLTLPDFGDIADTIRFQQESFDGSGSPRGLIGDQIPLGSRIIRVAAEYDLMMNSASASAQRVSHEQAIGNLRNACGSDLDPQIVQIFSEISLSTPLQANGIGSPPLTAKVLSHSLN